MRLYSLPKVLSDSCCRRWRELLFTSSDAKPSNLRSEDSLHLSEAPVVQSELLATPMTLAVRGFNTEEPQDLASTVREVLQAFQFIEYLYRPAGEYGKV
jgi:hypothetical protein